jgi:prepilin-type N-terminal cleavage/methylation domain-containing protein
MRMIRSAFTLIELLVVIAIIALLISILLPALKNAREEARKLVVMIQAQQMGVTHVTYATDMKEFWVPAGPHWDWTHGNHPYIMTLGDPWLAKRVKQDFSDEPKGGSAQAFDANDRAEMAMAAAARRSGTIITGSALKVWPIHVMAHMGLKPSQMNVDPIDNEDFRRRSAGAATAGTHYPPATSIQAAYGWHPNIGMNGVYIGGSYSHGAFNIRASLRGYNVAGGSNPQSAGGMFYIRRVSQVLNPGMMILGALSQGGDVGQGNWHNYGMNRPNGGTIRKGYWLITPPQAHPVGRGAGWLLQNPWMANRDFQPVPGMRGRHNNQTYTVGDFGNIDFGRFNGLGIFCRTDGSGFAALQRDVRDMRMWSAQATSANWVQTR